MIFSTLFTNLLICNSAVLASVLPRTPADNAISARKAQKQPPVQSTTDLSSYDETTKQLIAKLNQINPSAPAGAAAPAAQASLTSTATSGLNVRNITNVLNAIAVLNATGITPQIFGRFVDVLVSECNSFTNKNKASPKPIYPKKVATDAPYSIPEAKLREAIRIPSSFTYGQKPPVILVPGTGSSGCFTYSGNYIKLLSSQSYADPVWLNIEGYLLGDVQKNAEYVAYAINYISAVSNNKNVSVIGWSQGNLDTQWALKYWPSTHSITSDLIAISADFHGTYTTVVSCPGAPSSSCTPAIIQQGYNSNLVTRLRSNGGDSAYVPTTSIYSSTDNIVIPQTGTTASGFLSDARNVGVSNVELQTACPGQVAGAVYTHEGVLYNALAFALAVDALSNAGPGQLSRINLPTVCSQALPPGLAAKGLIVPEENTILAAVLIQLFEPKVVGEPPLKAYASS